MIFEGELEWGRASKHLELDSSPQIFLSAMPLKLIFTKYVS